MALKYKTVELIGSKAKLLERFDEDGFTVCFYIPGESFCRGSIETNAFLGWKPLYSFPKVGGLPPELCKKSNTKFRKWLRKLKREGYAEPGFLEQWDDFVKYPSSYK